MVWKPDRGCLRYFSKQIHSFDFIFFAHTAGSSDIFGYSISIQKAHGNSEIHEKIKPSKYSTGGVAGFVTSEIPDDPIWPMKSLSVRKRHNVYDISGYPDDGIGSLVEDILDSENLIKIESIYE